MRRRNLRILLLIFFVSFFLSFSTESSCRINLVNRDSKRQFAVRLMKEDKMPVSSHLIGFNAVYAYEADFVWSDGKIEQYLRDLHTTVMRYPGGTVSSFYHWNGLTGEGWKDSWDPENPVIPKAKSEFMDLDEFITLTRKLQFTPLLGVNMSSGRRWNRTEDGINEALSLMKYCRSLNFKVKYWYLDNEPYQQDSNGGSKTIEEYARLINMYVPRMKESDPEIKIIVNWGSAFKNKRDEYRKLLEIAGANIDIIDAHWYWSWSKPTFDKWLGKTPMSPFSGESYMSEIVYFRQMVREFGYPGIQLASLEWNVGPIRENQLSPDQCALIQSEMLMQFIAGGLDMAAFWPLQGAGEALTTRSFVRRSDREAQPAYPIFKFLGNLQGGSVIKNEILSPEENVLNLVAFDAGENTLRVCLLNKNSSSIMVDIKSELFKDLKLSEASAYVLINQGKGSSLQPMKLSKHSQGGISFIAPQISITMLTFRKK